jgi:DNA-binding XRE family transcriptional regulator
MDKINVDWSAVGSASSRAALRGIFEGMGREPRAKEAFWAKLVERRAVAVPDHLLVVSDLSRLAKSFQAVGTHAWTSAIRQSSPYIVALVRTHLDKSYAALVDDLMQASVHRLVVCDFTPSRSAELVPCLSKALAAQEATSIVHAAYSAVDDSLWLEFGDGLRASVAWGEVGVDEQQLGLLMETASSAEDLASVEFLQASGEIFDVDAGLLRARVDKKHASRVAARATQSRQTVGDRAKARRQAVGMTQTEVAEQSGLDQALISKLERGKHRPRFDTLSRYAGALGLTVSELLAEA